MMKKLPILLLAGLFACTMLSACNGGKEPEEPHIHTFAEAWSSDETCHWHAATCEHKNEVSEKSEHTMSEGKCSVCGYRAPVVLTKDTDFAALVSDKVTEEEWNAAFTNEGFSGCSGRLTTKTGTESETIDFSYDYIQNGDVIDVFGLRRERPFYIHWEGDLFRTYSLGEFSNAWQYADRDLSSLPSAQVKYMISFVAFTTYDFSGYYQKFTYDETKGAYVFEGALEFEYASSISAFAVYALNVRIDDAKVEIKFAGGKVAYVQICGTDESDEYEYKQSGEYPYREETYCLFDYDEPKVNFPEDAQPVPQG